MIHDTVEVKNSLISSFITFIQLLFQKLSRFTMEKGEGGGVDCVHENADNSQSEIRQFCIADRFCEFFTI